MQMVMRPSQQTCCVACTEGRKGTQLRFKYLEAKAPNLVSHHWRTVEELAEKMLNYQSIAGKEVANILRASRLAQMHEDSAP